MVFLYRAFFRFLSSTVKRQMRFFLLSNRSNYVFLLAGPDSVGSFARDGLLLLMNVHLVHVYLVYIFTYSKKKRNRFGTSIPSVEVHSHSDALMESSSGLSVRRNFTNNIIYLLIYKMNDRGNY